MWWTAPDESRRKQKSGYVLPTSSKIEITISYNRVTKRVIKRDLEDNSRETWQKEWETTNKGTITKEYFPK